MHRLCAVIPVRDQEFTVTDVVTQLIVAGLDVVLVDDGATPACADALDRLTRQDRIFLVRHRGHGNAVLTGLREARLLGYTHALQADADGRHDLTDIQRFVRQSVAAPDAVICGYRVSGTPVPLRLRIRDRAARVLVAIGTLSRDLRDPTCGFRMVPLASVLRLADTTGVGTRPGFDAELLVRLHWRRQPIYWLPVKIRRSVGGTSAAVLEHA